MAIDPRRAIPRTDVVMSDERIVDATARLGAGFVKAAVKAAQERARAGLIAPEEVADHVAAGLSGPLSSVRPVINATGVLLHTNLGRAPLSNAAREAVALAAGFTDVEYDAITGRRGRRGQAVIDALREQVPKAGDVLVVNNCAAAIVLVSSLLATGKEIIISRGEMIEIGDGFRLPDVLTSTGARLCEVGTTNRTTLSDYRNAVGQNTGFILKVHPSNFLQSGFVSSTPVRQLSKLEVPIVVDIGSGLLQPDRLLPNEPNVMTTLRDGAALVTCSGDKLLGGPQAGLIFGDARLVDRLRRHPLARALRVDKLTLAALHATVRGPRTPVDIAIHTSPQVLRKRAEVLVQRLRASEVDASCIGADSRVGGGGAPGVVLKSTAVSLRASYAEVLRRGEPMVVGRIERDRCLLDLRAVPACDDEALYLAIIAASEDAANMDKDHL